MDTFSLNIAGQLTCFEQPVVMAILNATPDSFVASTRLCSESDIIKTAEKSLDNGATILDIGGYSTRPGGEAVPVEEEWKRVKMAVGIIRCRFPEVILSVDTFRAEIARRSVLEYGVNIINDVSGGSLDDNMFATIADLQVPYILMHMRGTPASMQTQTDYGHLMAEIVDFFRHKIDTLARLGVKDVIIDPGFGFAKTVEQNYQLLGRMQELSMFHRPVLAGLSRKSMLYKVLNGTSEGMLNATTAVNMVALMGGVGILRVHDVRAAKEAVTMYRMLQDTAKKSI